MNIQKAHAIGQFIATVCENAAQEQNRLSQISRNLALYPAKTIAVFFYAPILMVRIVFKAKNPLRRVVAVSGLIVALIAVYGAGTFLGSLMGAALIASHVGYLMAVGFLVGSTVSVWLSVTFSIFVFNSIAFVFFKMTSQEVIDYLKEVSE